MMFKDLKVNESLTIGGIRITLLYKRGQVARLHVECHKDTEICKEKPKPPIPDVR